MLMAAELTTIIFIALLALVIFLLWKDASMKGREGLTTGGYGVTSGLYYNNIPQQCWTSSDPDDHGATYCSTIGRVVV